MNALQSDERELPAADLEIAQAMADIAAIGILHQRGLHQKSLLAEQLQLALNTRVVVEQAKGMVAQQLGTDPEGAFPLLRSYARGHNRRLAEIALEVLGGGLPAAALRPADLARSGA
jgi:AmiR/NasT family two-component response regulator